MDTIDGFMMLDEKKKSILPILAQYDFLSVLSAVYAITSWRNLTPNVTPNWRKMA